MANPSIYAAFERMWQQIVSVLGGKADKTDIVQSDMSQNDETAPDYVKNRTHWVENTGVQILEELTISESEFTQEEGMTMAVLPVEPIEIVHGKPYNVVFDGKNYLCQGYEDLDISAILPETDTIGDIMGGMTDWPFIILYGQYLIINSTPKNHTLAIMECNIHQINTAYIPDSISRVGRSGNGDFSEIFNDYVDSTANGQYAHAEGYITHADGDHSHAEGGSTQAGGESAHSEGCGTAANGNYSHAEGWSTETNGEGSHAEGVNTYANGDWSHAEGYNTKASGDYQHVQGKNNIEDTENKYAHIVGNGKNSITYSNAHTLDWDGNAWFAGEIKVGGTGQDDAEAKTLATTEYVDSLIGSVLTASY